MPLLGFPVFCLSSSIVLNRYFHILVNSMTILSVLKLPIIIIIIIIINFIYIASISLIVLGALQCQEKCIKTIKT